VSRIDKAVILEGSNMKIADASIQTKSAHTIESSKEVSQRLEIFSSGENFAEDPAFVLDIGSNTSISPGQIRFDFDEEVSGSEETEIKLKLIEDFLYQLTGKTFRLRSPKINIDSGLPVYNVSDKYIKVEQPRDNWGLVYEFKEVTKESENLRFSASGTVTTSDGRSVAFNLEFIMSREYVNEHYVNVQMGSPKVDPLVVVFGRTGLPKFSRIKAAFDIDSDGKEENISMPEEGSGFLALDKNEDGVINNGSELFGPTKGNGFEELRDYDGDGNGWIDENDEVFSKLSVLTTSQDGQKMTFKLGDLGIGAIYLGETGTQFDIKDEAGEHGEMKSSSVFIREDGSAGTIHHIDLVI
jgi:hypothetical protein